MATTDDFAPIWEFLRLVERNTVHYHAAVDALSRIQRQNSEDLDIMEKALSGNAWERPPEIMNARAALKRLRGGGTEPKKTPRPA
jgi:hypothetical protein